MLPFKIFGLLFFWCWNTFFQSLAQSNFKAATTWFIHNDKWRFIQFLVLFYVCVDLGMCEWGWSDAYSSVHGRFWQARGGKEDGKTELGQWAAELAASSAGVLNDWGRPGGPWVNTDITSLAFSHLARQPHVNITSMPTHTRSQICLNSHVCLTKAFNCCNVVVDWTIAFSYSSLKADKALCWLFRFWLLQHIWFVTKQSCGF